MRAPAAVVAAVALAAILGACAGDAPSPCAGRASPSAGTSPDADVDPDLADSFPDTVGGEPLEVGTFCAAHLELGGLETSPEMLDALGITIEDVTVAAVPPSIGTDGGSFAVGAYRFAGADENEIRDTFLRLLEDGMAELEMDVAVKPATVGGKDVHRLLGAVYYVSGETLYSVQSEDEATVVEIIEALP